MRYYCFKTLIEMKKLMPLVVCLLMVAGSYGQQSENTYVLNGELIEATLFHDNGKVAQKGFYTKDGKLQGEWTSFDIEGNKTATAFYDKGQKVGTWTFYMDGNLKEVTYQDSRIAEVKTYKETDRRVVSNR